MNNQIKIAVVLPVYNTARYLPECLDSLLSQTFKNFQIYAINDGSTDDSSMILHKYALRDNRIIVIDKVNEGVSSARNTALDLIMQNDSYSYIGFVDSDDVVSDDYLSLLVDAAIEHEAEYCVCGYEAYNREKKCKYQSLAGKIISFNAIDAIKHFCQIDEWARYPSNICMTTRFFKTSLIGSIRFNTKLVATEDQDFILRVLTGLNRGVMVPEVLYFYRQRASSLSHSKVLSTVQSSYLLAKNLLLDHQNIFPKEVRSGLELRACDCWWQEARRAYTHGTTSERMIVREFYKFIRSQCNVNNLPTKYKKRFFIFSCGDFVSSFYFNLLDKKRRKNMYE